MDRVALSEQDNYDSHHKIFKAASYEPDDRMASAFEHADLEKATSAKPIVSVKKPRKNKH